MQTAYFISDVHLAIKVNDKERTRRKELFALLDEVKTKQAMLVIVGDFFDFYFEWGSVVSATYLDVFAKLRELREAGIEIHYFAGNHDFWLGEFLESDLGITLHLHPDELKINDHRFFCIHGDGLAKDDHAYRRFRTIIRSSLSTWLFKWFVHPNLAHWIARQVSYRSRQLTRETEARLNALIDENITYAKGIFEEGVDYFITGHIHLPRIEDVAGKTFITIGDFLQHFSYAYYDGVNLSLKQWRVNSLPQRLLA